MSKQNIVKQTAKELGMTQKELAEKLKVSESTLRKWSGGEIDVPESALVTFSLLLELKKKNKVLDNFKSVLSDIQNI